MEENQELEEFPCGYFAGRSMRAEIYRVTPAHLFDGVLAQGFRRSGGIIYRAVCPGCGKCVPIRVRTGAFTFSKGQRHLLRQNADVELRITDTPLDFVTEEKAALFRKYSLRHKPDSALSIEEAQAQLEDMNCGYEGALNMEYRLDGRLIGCGIVDAGMSSLSSNYFYYDTDDAIMRRSPGTFSILKEIELCKRAGLAFYYLGYYIAECPQMKYKARFRPHELRDAASGEWAAPRDSA